MESTHSTQSFWESVPRVGGWAQKLDDRVLCLLSTLLIASNELHRRHSQIASAIGLQIASAVGGRDDVWEEGRLMNRRLNTFEYYFDVTSRDNRPFTIRY